MFGSERVIELLRLTCALLNPRRDDYGGDPYSQPIKREVKGLGPHDPVRARDSSDRRRHVVVKPTMFVVGDHEEGLVPLRARSQSLVHLLYEHLPLIHIVRGMVVVGRRPLEVEVPLLHHNVAGELACLCVFLERQAVLVELAHVLEFPQVPVEQRCGEVLVVYSEGYSGSVEVLEDGPLWVALCEKRPYVAGCAT